MEVVYVIFILLYVCLLFSMKWHWQQRKPAPPFKTPESKISILIPYRNESEQLPGLLLNLHKILEPLQEVIFINDQSEDGSREMITSFIRDHHQHHWVLLENHGTGKKAALTTGVHYSQSDIILTTDADCILPSKWVFYMGQAFSMDKIQLAAGPVMTVSQSGFFAGFQQIEWASILLMTRYLFSLSSPLMCSGANLAYRKSAFEGVGGYRGNEQYPSGDDEFLLKKIVRNYGPDAVTYLHSKQASVQTYPLQRFSTFLHQRIRWAAKWRLHRSTGHAFAALSAFMMAMIEASTLLLLFGPLKNQLMFLVFWVIKIATERIVLAKVLADYRIRHNLFVFARTSLMHPIYVIIVAFGTLIGKYSWKERNNHFKL